MRSASLAKASIFPLLLLQASCMSPMALDHAVMAYDQTATEIQSKQLLLNIARAHQHLPLHFTGVSSIAATFNFQFNAGATPAMTGESGSLMTPIFGGTASENPTITIVPIEGEEFTRRLLTPFQESKLTMLLRQGADIDLILRLLAGELAIKAGDHDTVYANKPSDKDSYRFFRQAVTHLSSIQDRHALYVEPLCYERYWSMPVESLSPQQLLDLEKEYKVIYDETGKRLMLSKPVTGHVLLTNYDPQRLSNDERIKLDEEAGNGTMNEVMVDIRSEFPGGELSLHGFFRLRSFYNVMNFIGNDLGGQAEFDVEKHPQTPFVSENPAHTLGITVTESEPDDAEISVKFGDWYYAVKEENGYPWNREGFRLLHQLFQMTMAELPQHVAPSITIAK